MRILEHKFLYSKIGGMCLHQILTANEIIYRGSIFKSMLSDSRLSRVVSLYVYMCTENRGGLARAGKDSAKEKRVLIQKMSAGIKMGSLCLKRALRGFKEGARMIGRVIFVQQCRQSSKPTRKRSFQERFPVRLRV